MTEMYHPLGCLAGHDVLSHHQERLLLLQEELELLVMPFVQLQTSILQLLVHPAGGLALILGRLPLLVVPRLHLLHTHCHGLQEVQFHCDGT